MCNRFAETHHGCATASLALAHLRCAALSGNTSLMFTPCATVYRSPGGASTLWKHIIDVQPLRGKEQHVYFLNWKLRTVGGCCENIDKRLWVKKLIRFHSD
jgi:hypothetical protein